MGKPNKDRCRKLLPIQTTKPRWPDLILILAAGESVALSTTMQAADARRLLAGRTGLELSGYENGELCLETVGHGGKDGMILEAEPEAGEHAGKMLYINNRETPISKNQK